MLDIETAPSTAYIWRLWQKVYNMDMVPEDWYILCWCAKWVKEKKVFSSALPDHRLYQKNPTSDIEVMKMLHPLLDEADIVVGHNVAQFDIKKINTRFLAHGIEPPSPYKTVDTLRIARRHFSFMSNKLNDIAQMLKLGKKQDTGGFKLWEECLAGKRASWKKMVSYCSQDVRLVEDVYYALLPYATGMPNFSVFQEYFSCPKCGSDNIQKRGFYYSNASKYQQYRCNECGSWSKSRKAEPRDKDVEILSGI